MDKRAKRLKVPYLYGKLASRCDRHKQESEAHYPGRVVFMLVYYPNKEENDVASKVLERWCERYSSQQTA